ncbi:MAG: SDR family NAD(P)-dependent oxidoreductase, partial [Actinomycetota bacterium]|nr:SDR family NAD(P)-dependent oxidoreductase [Actinomycetota bacterium]
MKQLDGKIAVITGAASGIGLALTKTFLSEGMKVVMADIDENSLSKTASELET